MLSACCGVWTNNQNVSNSANIYLFKDNNRNTGERAEKVTPFSSVSTVALEQVNNSWEKTNDEVATRELVANSSKKFCNNIIAKRMKKSCKAARFCDKQRYWPPFIKQTQCMNTVSYIPIVLWQDHLISKKKINVSYISYNSQYYKGQISLVISKTTSHIRNYVIHNALFKKRCLVIQALLLICLSTSYLFVLLSNSLILCWSYNRYVLIKPKTNLK